VNLNPIFRFELIRTARWRRLYVMRAALGLIPLYVTWELYGFWGQSGSRDRSIVLRHLPQLADLVFLALMWAEGLAVVLLVPVLVAGSIAEEDRRGTMFDLLGTPLSGGTIVLGKLAARLVHVGVAVAVGLPIVVSLGLLGALDPVIVALAYAMLLALTSFVGSLSLLVSVVVRRPRLAISAAYLWVGGWLLLPVWYAPIAGSWQTVYLAGVTPLVEWVSLASPIEIRWWLEGRTWEGRVGLPWGLWGTRIRLDPGLIWTYLASLTLHAIGTVALMRVAAWSFDSERDGHRRLSLFQWGVRRVGVPRASQGKNRAGPGRAPLLSRQRR
jgi:ABC-type transport system involved in multi-copper enzyme maturation permease subunit